MNFAGLFLSCLISIPHISAADEVISSCHCFLSLPQQVIHEKGINNGISAGKLSQIISITKKLTLTLEFVFVPHPHPDTDTREESDLLLPQVMIFLK